MRPRDRWAVVDGRVVIDGKPVAVRSRPLPLSPDELERFWVRVNRGGARSDCWQWGGAHDHKGYGVVAICRSGATPRTTTTRAHRVTYTALRGPIPAGMQIDHLCLNTGCCNPWHLEVVTASENVRRQWAVRRAEQARRATPEVAA